MKRVATNTNLKEFLDFDEQRKLRRKKIGKLKVQTSMEKVHICSHIIHVKSYEK